MQLKEIFRKRSVDMAAFISVAISVAVLVPDSVINVEWNPIKDVIYTKAII